MMKDRFSWERLGSRNLGFVTHSLNRANSVIVVIDYGWAGCLTKVKRLLIDNNYLADEEVN